MSTEKNKEGIKTGPEHDFTKLINTVHITFRQFFQQKFKEHNLDLTIEMVQVLRQLWEKDGINQQEIADAVEKDKTSLTYLIDNLSRRNLVERKEDPDDRRNKIIYLTEEGHKLRERLLVFVNEMFELVGKDIPEKEIQDVNKILEKIVKNVKG